MAVTIANTATTSVNNFATSPQTLTGLAIGAAAGDRLIFVTFADADGGGAGSFVTAVTVGGISATKVTGGSRNDGSGNLEIAVWWAAVPTGTTANVVLTFTGSLSNSGIGVGVYRVVGADTTTPVSASNTALDASATAPAPSASITIPTSGALLASVGAQNLSAVAFSGWTNATADQSVALSAAFVGQLNTALSTTSGTPTVTASYTGTNYFNALLSLVAIQAAAAGDTLSAQQLRFM